MVQVGPVTYRPGLPVALRPRMWEGQAALQAQGKLVWPAPCCRASGHL